VSRASARGMLKYVRARLRLKTYLLCPGDGRPRPAIAARHLLWALLIGHVLRENSHHAVEWLVRSRARRAMGVGRAFGDDALGYFTERLDPEPTREAVATACRQAKRNKAFDNSRFIGMAVDGTAAGRSTDSRCGLCHPIHNEDGKLLCHLHQMVMITLVGTGLSLPVDVEPYAEGDSEYGAGQRALRRAVAHLGPRFADYAVVDAKFATAPFLHTAGELGLKTVARLKSNLPELFNAAQRRFDGQPPHLCFTHGADRVEVWDADDFDPWESLQWTTVRVMRYRQYKPDHTVVEAYWLTDFSARQVGSEALFRIAKSRWEVENQGFNDGKNRYGMEHIAHHEANSVLIHWLLIVLALTVERLYRLRYLRRGPHPSLTPIELVRILRLDLGASRPNDSS
jgi:hypothetical protein